MPALVNLPSLFLDFSLLVLRQDNLRVVRAHAILIPEEELKHLIFGNRLLVNNLATAKNCFTGGVEVHVNDVKVKDGVARICFEELKIEKFSRQPDRDHQVHEVKYRIVFLADVQFSAENTSHKIWVCSCINIFLYSYNAIHVALTRLICQCNFFNHNAYRYTAGLKLLLVTLLFPFLIFHLYYI